MVGELCEEEFTIATMGDIDGGYIVVIKSLYVYMQ